MDTLKPLIEKLPRVRLIPGPTPLHPLRGMPEKETAVPVYIKRDDLTGLGPGGNKLRSLEFILGHAIQEGADCIIASGPLQSNLCTLTAAACARLGLPCTLVVNGEKPEREEGNLLLNRLLGAETIYAGPVSSTARAVRVEEEYERLQFAGHHPFIVKNGATTGWGVLGYTVAAEEIRDQCRGARIKELTIFVPGGNGGVAAGLLYGNALLGRPLPIVVISVEDDRDLLTRHIEQVLQETEKITGTACPKPVSELGWIVDDYRGNGWGSNTEESAKMVLEFARREGIIIENVYNSKVVVGMRDWIRKGKVAQSACYLHTGGFGSLFSQY